MATPGFKVGDRVQYNSDGRLATVRYAGQVEFLTGEWVGVELDDFSGKNDGSVKEKRYFNCEMKKGMFTRATSLTLVKSVAGVRKISPVGGAGTAAKAGGLKKPTRPSSLGARSNTMVARPGTTAVRPTSMKTTSPTPAAASELARSTSLTKPTPKSQPATTKLSRTSMGPPLKAVKPSIPPPAAGAGSKLAAKSATSTVKAPPANRLSLAARAGAYSKAPQRLAMNTSPVKSRPVSRPASREREGDSKAPRPEGPTSAEPHILPAPRSPTGNSFKTADSNAPNPVRQSASVAQSSEFVVALGEVERSILIKSPSSAQQPSNASSLGEPEISEAHAATAPEDEPLETEVRMLDKQNLEDLEPLDQVERFKSQVDKLKGIINRMEEKFKPQKQQIADLKEEIKVLEAKIADHQAQLEENEEALEHAVVHQQVAEQETEDLQYKLNASQSQVEALKLDVQSLKGRASDEMLSQMTEEEKKTMGVTALETTITKLKEALLGFRDTSHEKERELNRQIKEFQASLDEMTPVKELYETCKTKLAATEAQVEDLRQQLDSAFGAQEMIEQLTDQNLSKSEKIEVLESEAKTMDEWAKTADELEQFLEERGKESDEMIERKENGKEKLKRALVSSEDYIKKLKDRVRRAEQTHTKVQAELEEARASQALQVAELEKLSSESRALMNENLQLQNSAVDMKTMANDFELHRILAERASDLLDIHEPFMPEEYGPEMSSVHAMLAFKTLGSKTKVLISGFETRARWVEKGHEDEVFAALEALNSLKWVKNTCDCFYTAMSHCSPGEFIRFEGAHSEIMPVDRAIDSWIGQLTDGGISNKQCARDLRGLCQLMLHLRSVHLGARQTSPTATDQENNYILLTHAHDLVKRADVTQYYLANAVKALDVVKNMVYSAMPAGEGDHAKIVQLFNKKTDGIIKSTTTAEIIAYTTAGKLNSLTSRCFTLPPNTRGKYAWCESAALDFFTVVVGIGENLHALFSEEGRQAPFTCREIESTIQAYEKKAHGIVESDVVSIYESGLENLTAGLLRLKGLVNEDSDVQEIEFEYAPHPWVVRAQELLAAKTVPVEAEEEMKRLKEVNHEHAFAIAMKERTLCEQSVEIEVLKRRVKNAHKQESDKVKRLEAHVDSGTSHQRALEEKMEAMTRELAEEKRQKEEWKRIAAERLKDEGSPGRTEQWNKIDGKRQQIADLQAQCMEEEASIKYIREEKRRAKLSTAEVGNHVWMFGAVSPAKPKRKQDVAVGESNNLVGQLYGTTSTSNMFEMKADGMYRSIRKPVVESPHGHPVVGEQQKVQEWKGWEEEIVSTTVSAVRRVAQWQGVSPNPFTTPTRRQETNPLSLPSTGIKTGGERSFRWQPFVVRIRGASEGTERGGGEEEERGGGLSLEEEEFF